MFQYQKVLQDAQHDVAQLSIPEKLLRLSRDTLFQEKEAIFDDCQTMQQAVLQEIWQRAKGSIYAREHGFDQVYDLATWCEQVPITTYEDYLPYIDNEMNGAPHQLYHANTELYVATTGSTGKIKLFMESAAGNAAKLLVMAVRGMYMSVLLPVTQDMDAKNLTISNYIQLGNSPDGKPIMRASGQTARNLRKKTGTMNILSTQFWDIPDIAPKDREYMMAVFALAESRFSKVFCNNLYALGRVLDQIEQYDQQMVEDVRQGSFSVVQDATVEAILQELLPLNEARAQDLQALLDAQERLITTPEDLLKIWPNFQMVSGWLSGSVGRDAREVLRRLPKATKCFEMGYGASEGKFNIPTKLATAAGVAASFAVFFEFRPLHGDGETLFLWEVQDGEEYELIITTYSGLYRYNMLDIVRVEGFIGNTPNIKFCGKSTEFVHIGEHKVYGYQFSDLLHDVEKEDSVHFDIVQVFVQEEKLYYVLQSVSKVDYDRVKQTLDRESFARWKITSEAIYVMKEMHKQHEFDKRVTTDRGACGIKLPIVLQAAPDQNDVAAIIR